MKNNNLKKINQKATMIVGDLREMFGCGVGKCFNACCFLVLASSLLSGVRTIFLIWCFTLEAEESCCLAVVSEPFVRSSADVVFLFRQHPIEIINIIQKLTKGELHRINRGLSLVLRNFEDLRYVNFYLSGLCNHLILFLLFVVRRFENSLDLRLELEFSEVLFMTHVFFLDE